MPTMTKREREWWEKAKAAVADITAFAALMESRPRSIPRAKAWRFYIRGAK